MRKTKEEAEQTREAIVDAAEQVFYDQGVAGASLEEIARVAGVTRGAVYWHFDSKLHIFEAIGQRAILPHDEAIRWLQQTPHDDPLTALEQCVTANFAAFGRDERARIRLTVQLLRCDYVGDMAPALAGHAALIHRISAQFTRYFCEKLVPRSRTPDCPGEVCHPEVAAKAFAAMLHGTLTLWLRSPAEFPLDSVGVANVRTFIRMLRLGLRPASPGFDVRRNIHT